MNDGQIKLLPAWKHTFYRDGTAAQCVTVI